MNNDRQAFPFPPFVSRIRFAWFIAEDRLKIKRFQWFNRVNICGTLTQPICIKNLTLVWRIIERTKFHTISLKFINFASSVNTYALNIIYQKSTFQSIIPRKSGRKIQKTKWQERASFIKLPQAQPNILQRLGPGTQTHAACYRRKYRRRTVHSFAGHVWENRFDRSAAVIKRGLEEGGGLTNRCISMV